MGHGALGIAFFKNYYYPKGELSGENTKSQEDASELSLEVVDKIKHAPPLTAQFENNPQKNLKLTPLYHPKC